MIQRLSKCLLLASVAFIYTLIVLNNWGAVVPDVAVAYMERTGGSVPSVGVLHAGTAVCVAS